MNNLLDKLSCGAEDHGYRLFEQDAQSGSWRIAAQWNANVHASKQDSLRTAAIEALAGPPCFSQVRCTLLRPICAYTESWNHDAPSAVQEDPVCSLGLSSDLEDEEGGRLSSAPHYVILWFATEEVWPHLQVLVRRLEAMGYKGLEGLVHRDDDHMTEVYKTRLVLGALMDEDIWSRNGRLSLPQEVMQLAFACADCNSQG